MLHLGIGRAHARTEIIILIHNHDATIVSVNGTALGTYDLNPGTGYQSKRKRLNPKPRARPFKLSEK
jgi:hypothetical protein